MRTLILVTVVAAVAYAPQARADWGSPPPAPAPRTERTEPGAQPGEGDSPRAQAELWYGDGYREVVRATMDVKRGKTKDAEKRWTKAREKLRRAVEIDSAYAEAWNLIGFTSRKLGEFPESFSAYVTALRLEPDYAEAREYYGQGLLESGDLAGAKRQLELLRGLGDELLTAQLEQSIRDWEAEHAAADSTTAES